MDSVRVGIIGFGGMGSHHGRYLAQGSIAGAKLTAVCDIDLKRLDAAREICGEEVKLFENAEDLIASGLVDGILIATPHYLHPPLAIQAFQKGLHVLSEKPAGVYTKQVREMNEAADASGKVFGLMFNQRTIGAHQKMRDLVQSGELGEILRTHYVVTTWFRTQAYYDSGGWRATWAGEGGGVLINQCPHNLDLWQWICGLPKRVFAWCQFGRYYRIEVEDDVSAIVEYENGATGVFVTNTGEAPGTNALEVVGDRGKLLMQGGTITFWRTRVPSSQFLNESPQMFASPETWKCEIPVPSGGGKHEAITQNWVDAIRKGTPLLADGREGIRSLQISNAMHLSAWTGGWVEIPVDEDLYLKTLQEKIKASTFVKKTDARTPDFTQSF